MFSGARTQDLSRAKHKLHLSSVSSILPSIRNSRSQAVFVVLCKYSAKFGPVLLLRNRVFSCMERMTASAVFSGFTAPHLGVDLCLCSSWLCLNTFLFSLGPQRWPLSDAGQLPPSDARRLPPSDTRRHSSRCHSCSFASCFPSPGSLCVPVCLAYTHACTHACTYAHTHARMHTLMYAHMHACSSCISLAIFSCLNCSFAY